MRQYRYGIHWLSIVVDGSKSNVFTVYNLFFKDLFGELQFMGHGGKFFEEIWFSLLGFKIYVLPTQSEYLASFNLRFQGKLANRFLGKSFKV